MCAASGGSLEKALFEVTEGPNKGTFLVQYNPKEFKVERSVDWQEHQDEGQTTGHLEFTKGKSQVVSMELIFDTTAEAAVTDVRTAWVNRLLAMTNADSPGQSGEAQKQAKKRPPKLFFKWGSFEMTCVLESISTSYLMFSNDGTPLRARCSVTLREWAVSSFAMGSGGKSWAGNKIRLVEARPGDTVTSVANEHNADPREVAEDNNIDDPMQDLGGRQVTVRVP